MDIVQVLRLLSHIGLKSDGTVSPWAIAGMGSAMSRLDGHHHGGRRILSHGGTQVRWHSGGRGLQRGWQCDWGTGI